MYRLMSQGVEQDLDASSVDLSADETLDSSVDDDKLEEGLSEPHYATLAAKPPDETATGGYRDDLAAFAAAFAFAQQQQQQQALQQQVQHGEPERQPAGAAHAQQFRVKGRAFLPGARRANSRKFSEVRPLSTEDQRARAREIWWSGVRDRTYKRMRRVCWCKGVYMVPLLGITSLIVALIGVLYDVVGSYASRGYYALATLTNLTVANWALFLLWIAVLSGVAVYLTVFWFPNIQSSGVPEMRAILSGARLPAYL